MKKTRVVVFGNFYLGFNVLYELLCSQLHEEFEVVGVATDDPSQPFIIPQKTVWQYPHTKEEENLVQKIALKYGIPLYLENVNSEQFFHIFQKEWLADIGIIATFEQKLDEKLFEFPAFGFYNLHPSSNLGWPSCAGLNPFEQLLSAEHDYITIIMHRVDSGFETGDFIATTRRIPIPYGATVIDMHKITSPCAAEMAVRELKRIKDAYVR